VPPGQGGLDGGLAFRQPVEGGGDMAMRQGPVVGEGFVVGGDDDTALQDPAQALDLGLRPVGGVSQARFLTLPPSRQLSRRRMARGEERLGTDPIYMADMSLDGQRWSGEIRTVR
jgi:hypothetical protein